MKKGSLDLDRIVSEIALGWSAAPYEPKFQNWISCSTILCEALVKYWPMTEQHCTYISERLGHPGYFALLCADALGVGNGEKATHFFAQDDGRCCKECYTIAAAFQLQTNSLGKLRLIHLAERWTQLRQKCDFNGAFSDRVKRMRSDYLSQTTEERRQQEYIQKQSRQTAISDGYQGGLQERLQRYDADRARKNTYLGSAKAIEKAVRDASNRNESSVEIILSSGRVQTRIVPGGDWRANLLDVGMAIRKSAETQAEIDLAAMILARICGGV